uniref:Uncharacterized protein n=1 Tax=Tanacetum cinerariifolium TaxID=118510 RepID=A0A6L2K6J0_TANCI|nr:hypothetical protein [Tanacetum cinerariifolium]
MRIEEGASWDLDNSTWGGRVEVYGTVSVSAGAQEWCREEDGVKVKKAGNSVVILLGWGKGLGKLQNWPLGFNIKGLVKLQFGSLWFIRLRTNENKGGCQVGLRAKSHGVLGIVEWYCSGMVRVHRNGVGRDG